MRYGVVTIFGKPKVNLVQNRVPKSTQYKSNALVNWNAHTPTPGIERGINATIPGI